MLNVSSHFMFDKQEYRQTLNALFGDNMTPDQIESILSRLERTYRNVKLGENVIHLSFIGDLFTDTELGEFKDKLSDTKYELSYLDESLIPKAFYNSFDVPTFLFLNEALGEILKNGLIYPALWEVIKYITKKAWDKTRKNVYQKYTSSSRKKLKSNTGIKIKLSKKKGLRFKINGDLSEETVDKSLDKIKEIVESYRVEKKGDSFSEEDTYRLTKSGKWKRIYGPNPNKVKRKKRES